MDGPSTLPNANGAVHWGGPSKYVEREIRPGALGSPSKYQCLCQYWPENSEPRALGVPSSFLVQGSVLPSRSAVRCIGQPLIPVHWTTPHLSWCRGQYCPRDLRSCALGSPLLCIEQVPQPLQMGQVEHRQLKIFMHGPLGGQAKGQGGSRRAPVQVNK